MSEITYWVWFEPAANGRGDYLPDAVYHQRATAETVADHYNATNNPAWKGTFSVVEHIGGKPNS